MTHNCCYWINYWYSEAPFKCTGHGKKFKSFCYVLSKSGDMKSWPEALNKCEKMGGTLAMIKDANTNKFIVNLIKKVSKVGIKQR